MEGILKKWGNSYAIRVTKRETARLHLREGQRVLVLLQPMPGTSKVDLSKVPTFSDPTPLKQARAETYAGKQRWER